MCTVSGVLVFWFWLDSVRDFLLNYMYVDTLQCNMYYKIFSEIGLLFGFICHVNFDYHFLQKLSVEEYSKYYLFLSLCVYTFLRMVLLSFQVTGSQLSQCFAVRNSVVFLAKTKTKAWLSVIMWANSNLLYFDDKCLSQLATFNRFNEVTPTIILSFDLANINV